MGFRFRRTIGLGKGVRLNLTKTGISTTVGPQGSKFTTGTHGTTVSAGLPGSGLHYSQKIAGSSGIKRVGRAAGGVALFVGTLLKTVFTTLFVVLLGAMLAALFKRR